VRAATYLALFAVLVGTACGGKNKNSGKPKLATKFPAAAYGTLTETELTQFIKFLPTFSAVLKAANWNPSQTGPNKGLLGALAPLVEGMNVPGLKDSLKAIGSDWGTFRATLYKVLAARAIVGISENITPEIESQMQQDTTQAMRQQYADYQNVKNAAKAIPEANKELVKKYEKELDEIRRLGHE
jgi:hypothetical protein